MLLPYATMTALGGREAAKPQGLSKPALHVEIPEIVKPKHMPRILLIDDDPLFGKVMQRAANAKSIPLSHCSSLEEFSQIKSFDYDVMIVDYNLGAVTGFELTRYIEQFTAKEVPVILVSQSESLDYQDWPTTVMEFVHKSVKPQGILEATLDAYETTLVGHTTNETPF